MSRWLYWEQDFKSEDETCNFGTRKLHSSNNGLEEWLTLCTFENVSEDTKRRSVNAAVCDTGLMCVSLDCSVFLFEDQTCSNLLFSSDVGGRVECCCLVNGTNDVLVALDSGYVCCFNSHGKIVFKSEIPIGDLPNGHKFVDLIIENKGKKKNGFHNVLVIGYHESIHRISWCYTDEKCNMCVSCVKLESSSKKISSAMLIPRKELTIAFVGDFVNLWSDTIEHSFEYSAIGLQQFMKVQLWKDNLIICLTSDGKLAVLCVNTLLCCKIWSEVFVQHFMILKNENDMPTDTIATISKPHEEPYEMCVIIASMPDFKIIHKVRTSESSWLVSGSRNVMCLEGFKSYEQAEKIKINVLSTSLPAQRLQLLLSKQKFEEAEEFAKKFGLEVEPVLKQRATSYIRTLCSNHDSFIFKELISVLDRITDIQFIASLCLGYLTYHIDDMLHLLVYSMQRIETFPDKEKKSINLQRRHSELNAQYCCIQTYLFLKGSADHCYVMWKNILNNDWFNTCCTYITKCEVKRAKFIWFRHLERSDLLKHNDIKQLYELIPLKMKQCDVFAWLELLIPYLLCNASYIMEDLFEWVTKRVRLLENCQDSWPCDAISFVKEFQNLINKLLEMIARKANLFPTWKMEHLSDLRLDLQEIKLLIDDYSIKLTLNTLLNEEKIEVATCILKKTAQQDIERMLNDYMVKFVEKHALTMDSVLLYFVRKYLAAISEHWLHSSVNHWEPFIATFISHIESAQHKVDCIVDVLKFASVPWSNPMIHLANLGCKLIPLQAPEIKKLQKLADIKLVFKNYMFERDLLESVKFQRPVTLFLIRRIICECREGMLKDALTIADGCPELLIEVYSLCAHNYIYNNKFDEALNMFLQLDSKTINMCCGRLFCRLEIETDLSLLYNYISFLDSLSSRISIQKYHQELEDIRNLDSLKTNFSCMITYHDYKDIGKRKSLLKTQLQQLLKWALDNEIDNNLLILKAKTLSQLFGLPYVESFCEIFKRVVHKEEDLSWSFSKCSRGFIDLQSKNLLRNIQGTNEDISHTSVMINTVLHHKISMNDPWLHILTWINRARNLSTVNVIRNVKNTCNYKLLVVYNDSLAGFWKLEVLNFVKAIFHFVESFAIEDEVISKLYSNFDTLKKKDMYIIVISLLNIFYCGMSILNGQDMKVIDSYQKEILEELLSKLIRSQSCDICLANGILYSMDQTSANSWLHNSVVEFRVNFKILERVAKMGVTYCKLKKLNDLKHFVNLKKECSWARYLQKKKIVCDKILAEDKYAFTKKIILENDIEIAKQFCNSFGLIFEDVLPACLEKLILSWEPQFDIKTIKEGNMIEVKDNMDITIEKSLKIAKSMEKEPLKTCLHFIKKNLIYYNYEMFICLNVLKYQVLGEDICSASLLLFLMKYQRISSVQKEERENWMDVFPSSHNFPPIAQWRLPFWPHKMLSVVKEELTLDTYKQWIPMAGALNTSEDTIRITVLTQSVSQLNASIPCDADWCTNVMNEKAISQIKICANEIKNKEMAGAVLYRICHQVKGGADKVLLTKLCLEHCCKWENSEKNELTKNALQKVNNLYINVATSNILYRHKLESSCYLNKVSCPELLIKELYNHPSITNRNHTQDSYCPHINDAVQEITMLHNKLELNKLCKRLLMDWLTPTNVTHAKFDDSITFQGTSQTILNCNQIEEENLLRASYLLRKDDTAPLLNYLLCKIFACNEEDCYKFKQNALFCVMKASSLEHISRICGKSECFIQKYFKILNFVNDLNSLGYIITVSQLQHCKMHDLVTELIGNGSQKSSVLNLAAHLAIEFEVFDDDVWLNLLKFMMQCRMSDELGDILPKLPNTTPNLIEAWSFVLFAPFEDLSSFCTLEQESQLCEQSLQFLIKCPHAGSIDLKRLADLYFKLDCPEWASLLLPFMCRDIQEVFKKRILEVCSATQIISKFSTIQDDFIISNVLRILEERVQEDDKLQNKQ